MILAGYTTAISGSLNNDNYKQTSQKRSIFAAKMRSTMWNGPLIILVLV